MWVKVKANSLITKMLAITLVVASFTAGFCANYWFVRPELPKKSTTNNSQREPYVVSLWSNTLFFGNAYFSRYINDHAMVSPLKFAYPFSRLNEFHRDSYDAWVTGLECPSVAGLQQTSAQEDATLSFNCRPDYLPEMSKWFTVVTLANNHTDNQGLAGFNETKSHLEKNHIQYFGNPDPRELNDICDVISVPVKVSKSDKSVSLARLPVAMCGYHWFIRMPQADALAVMRQYSEYMPVLALPHGGTEYQTSPDQIKTTLYRGFIDNGADIVLGDHPHVVQPSEVYKGKPIFYSMGNFIFDQQNGSEVTRSAAINVIFEVNNADPKQLYKWLEIGKTCQSLHDTCLAKAKEEGLKKLPFKYKIGIVGTDDRGYITKPATPEVQAGILQRLNWDSTKALLQAPYSPL